MHDDKLSPHPSLHQLCKPDLKQVLKSSQALGLLQRILVSLSTAANISACQEKGHKQMRLTGCLPQQAGLIFVGPISFITVKEPSFNVHFTPPAVTSLSWSMGLAP